MNIRIAGAQIPVTRDIEANLKAIHRAMDFAVAEKADVLLTPEGSLSGYTWEFDPELAEAALTNVITRAREEGLALALGTCFAEPAHGKIYNQVRFYDGEGAYLGFHSKILTCGSLDDPPTGEINHSAVKPLDTFTLDGIRVGALICNDLWANPQCTPMPDPHLTQQLARMGARILFHAVNGGSRDRSEASEIARQFHETNLRMRAKAGKLWIVTVDSCHPTDQPCSAPSGVIDPKGNWVVKAEPQGERLFVHQIELQELENRD